MATDLSDKSIQHALDREEARELEAIYTEEQAYESAQEKKDRLWDLMVNDGAMTVDEVEELERLCTEEEWDRLDVIMNGEA